MRDPGQLRQRGGPAGPEIRPQRHLLPGAAGHRPVHRRAEQRPVRPGPYRPADHPDRRRLPCVQLHPPAAQGPGQGGLPPDPGGQPELFRPGKGQRLPDGPAPAAAGGGLHLLRGYAVRPAQPDRPLRGPPRRRRPPGGHLDRPAGPGPAGRQGLHGPGNEAHLPPHRPGVCRHPQDPGAQGQGGRRGRDLRQIQPPGQQRPAEVPGVGGVRGQLPRPDGLLPVLHLQHGGGLRPLRRQRGPQVWLRPPAGLAGRHRAGHAQGHIQRGLLRPRPL